MGNFVTRLFNFDIEKALAKEMAEQIVKTVSPILMTERRRVLSAKKVTLSIEGTYEVAKAYQSERKPGAIRRAVLANNFKWELNSLGYPEDFIDVATEGLIFALEIKTGSKTVKPNKR